MASEYWTTAEVAIYLRQPESTIRYWRVTGYGPAGWKAGRRVLYAVTEVKRWAAEAQAAQAAAAKTG
jgi:hypothetical protein